MSRFVLVPGAGGSAWYWHRVGPELVARGHAVTAVDLPADDDAAGFEEYADVVLAELGDRTDLVVVGQSMGAYTAALVAARRPVRLLVLVNAMTPRPGESAGEWWGNVGFEEARREQAAREGRRLEDDPDHIEAFFHDVPADVRAEAFARAEPQQSGAVFAKPWPLSSWPDVPTRFLAGRDDRFFPIEMQRRVVPERLGIAVDEMPGGHLSALSQPVKLAERLVAYSEAGPAADDADSAPGEAGPGAC
ncbi:MAG TPA: alpha/beta fold hydrolase [Pseudonocardia sp.]